MKDLFVNNNDDHVHTIDGLKSFRSLTLPYSIAMVVFGSKDCKYTQAMVPTIRDLANLCRNNDCIVIYVEASLHPDVVPLQVDGYPSLYFYQYGIILDEYLDDNDANTMWMHMQRYMYPLFHEIATEDDGNELLDRAARLKQRVVLVHGIDDVDKVDELSTSIADIDDNNELVFGALTYESTTTHAFIVITTCSNITQASKCFNDESMNDLECCIAAMYDEMVVMSFNHDIMGVHVNIEKWLDRYRFPPLFEMNEKNAAHYVSMGLPIVFLYLNDDNNQIYKDIIRRIAVTNDHNNILYATVKSSSYPDKNHRDEVRLDIVDYVKYERYKYEGSMLNYTNINEFINLYRSNKLRPVPIPYDFTYVYTIIVSIIGGMLTRRIVHVRYVSLIIIMIYIGQMSLLFLFSTNAIPYLTEITSIIAILIYVRENLHILSMMLPIVSHMVITAQTSS